MNSFWRRKRLFYLYHRCRGCYFTCLKLGHQKLTSVFTHGKMRAIGGSRCLKRMDPRMAWRLCRIHFFVHFYGLSSFCLLKIIKITSVTILTTVPVKSIKFSNVINPEDPVAVTASSNVIFSIDYSPPFFESGFRVTIIWLSTSARQSMFRRNVKNCILLPGTHFIIKRKENGEKIAEKC